MSDNTDEIAPEDQHYLAFKKEIERISRRILESHNAAVIREFLLAPARINGEMTTSGHKEDAG